MLYCFIGFGVDLKFFYLVCLEQHLLFHTSLPPPASPSQTSNDNFLWDLSGLLVLFWFFFLLMLLEAGGERDVEK